MHSVCELNILEALYIMSIDFDVLLHVWVRCSAKVNQLSILTPKKFVVLQTCQVYLFSSTIDYSYADILVHECSGERV
jgi:hypothetical protein